MRMPLTIRVIYHSVRSAWVAAMLAAVGWVGLVDATPAERQVLGAQVGDKRPTGLVEMRVARVLLRVAPDRAANILSTVSGGEISPQLAGMVLRDLANNGTGQAPQAPRRANGAKFITPTDP